MIRRYRVSLVIILAVIVLAVVFLKPSKPAQAAIKAAPQTAMTVTLSQPETQNWPQTVQANGRLAAWQEAVISAEVGNLRITDILVDVGSSVKKGQVLALLAQNSLQNDWQKQQAAVAQAEAALSQASSNAERARKVKDTGVLSQEKFIDYQIAETTAKATLAAAKASLASIQLQLAQTRIVAVDDGIVTSRSAVLGSVVTTGTELFRLLRQGRIEWQAELDSQQLAQVKAGQTAQVSLPDGQVVTGNVRLVAPTLNSNTGRGLVYVSLPTANVRAGMYSSGEIALAASPALTVPASAIVLRDGRSYIFSVDAQQQAVRKLVTTGRYAADRVEITSGLTADTAVVESGGAFLSEGMKVTIKRVGG